MLNTHQSTKITTAWHDQPSCGDLNGRFPLLHASKRVQYRERVSTPALYGHAFTPEIGAVAVDVYHARRQAFSREAE